jgi:hypothetical protein
MMPKKPKRKQSKPQAVEAPPPQQPAIPEIKDLELEKSLLRILELKPLASELEKLLNVVKPIFKDKTATMVGKVLITGKPYFRKETVVPEVNSWSLSFSQLP